MGVGEGEDGAGGGGAEFDEVGELEGEEDFVAGGGVGDIDGEGLEGDGGLRLVHAAEEGPCEMELGVCEAGGGVCGAEDGEGEAREGEEDIEEVLADGGVVAWGLVGAKAAGDPCDEAEDEGG